TRSARSSGEGWGATRSGRATWELRSTQPTASTALAGIRFSSPGTELGRDNPADGRSYLVRLTPEGRSLPNKARPAPPELRRGGRSQARQQQDRCAPREPDRAPSGDRRGAGQ